MTLLLNVFDYFILVKYYNTFLGERRRSSRLFFGLHSAVMIWLGMYINSLGVPSYNLMVTFSIIFLTSLFYKERVMIRIIIMVSYLGMAILAELFVLCIISGINIQQIEEESMLSFLIILVCQLFKFSLVMLLSTFKREHNQKLPNGTSLVITLIFGISTIGCAIANWYPINENHGQNSFGMLIIIVIFLCIFLLLFILIDKFNRAVRLNYEQSLIIQESLLKESYYKEIDKNNMQLRKISHDFKNRLAPLIELTEEDIENAKITIRNLFDDISNMEGVIYTRNNALNSICKIKFAKAKNLDIKIDYELDLPEVINISYGDMGIIFGNILDNAIEACEKINTDKRVINLKVQLYNKSLLIYLENSKSPDECIKNDFVTSKADRVNHGFGMKSVIDTIKKYNGMLDIEDEKDVFKLNIILNGIE